MHGAAQRQPAVPAGPRQDDTAREAAAAITRMETELTAALRRVSNEPGREHDLKELAWLGVKLWEAREALEDNTEALKAEAGRQLVIAQAFAAGEASGMAKAVARRERRLRPVSSLPDTWAG